jgi:hypothetical protein
MKVVAVRNARKKLETLVEDRLLQLKLGRKERKDGMRLLYTQRDSGSRSQRKEKGTNPATRGLPIVPKPHLVPPAHTVLKLAR